MHVVSVNVGRPREVAYGGRIIRTGIWKSPVEGPVLATPTHLAGDEQADRQVHGGPDKAVYAYPAEHYAFWRSELGEMDLPWGAFGENLTVAGLDEREVGIGDRFAIGATELMVTMPRIPCFKLALRLGREDIVPRFEASGRSGFYLRVLTPGPLAMGEAIVPSGRAEHGVSVAALFALIVSDSGDEALLRRAAALPTIPAGARAHFRRRLERLAAGSAGGPA
jgi:MOSC domain-containing protein YiiM